MNANPYAKALIRTNRLLLKAFFMNEPENIIRYDHLLTDLKRRYRVYELTQNTTEKVLDNK